MLVQYNMQTKTDYETELVSVRIRKSTSTVTFLPREYRSQSIVLNDF